MEGLYKAVTKGSYSNLPPIYSQELQNLLKMLLQVRPEARPDCDKILAIPII